MRKFTMFLALLLFVGVQGLLAQTRVITGTVTSSEDKQPVPGVTVVVKGTTIGVNTNEDGKYVLSVPAKYDLLVFSFVGMKTKEVTIGNQTIIDVVMEPDVLDMDEIVVTAIGIPREAKALSYSVQGVGADDIAKASRGDVLNTLSGKLSDVQVINSSGAAGASAYITIRGIQSLLGNNQPLFVVDGVPINNSGGVYGVDGVATSGRVVDLNPGDIQSIDVLKGGAATAIYGLEAASGAIIITTKKGQAVTGKKIAVTFNSSVSFDQVSKLLKLQNKYAQGNKKKFVSGNRNSWGPRIDTCTYDPVLTGTSPATYNYWPGFDVNGAIVSKNKLYAPNGTGAEVQTYDPYDFFQTGITTNNSLSLTGGSEVANFYFSFSDNQSKGVIPNNKFRRNTFKITGEAQLSDKFRIGGTANYIITAGDRIQQGSNTSGVMLGLLRTSPTFDNNAGYLNPRPDLFPTDPYGYPLYQRSYRHGSFYDNPYWTANMNKYHDVVNRLIGTAQIDYFATKWLSFTYRMGVDWWSRKVKDQLAAGSGTQVEGWVRVTQELNKDFNSDLIMTIDKDFAEDFNVRFILGQNMRSLYFSGLYGNANGLVIPEYYNLNNTTSQSTSEVTTQIRRAAFYGDLLLSWKNMIYLSLTGREDWSTTLPDGKNAFFYPSVGIGWIFTELPGLKDNKILPYGKFRASYAIVAKDAIPYRTSTPFVQPLVADGWTTGVVFPYMGYNGYTLSDALGNTELKPEKTKSWEIGIDLKFWKNRVGLSYTFFNNKGQDLLLDVPIAATTGYTTLYQNAGSMKTYGHEITLDVVPIKSKDWDWDIIVNFAKINNEVLELAPGIENLFLGGFTEPQIRAVVGQPYRTIYGYDWKRDADGNVLIGDDGYPIQGDAQVEMGNVDPDWTMGIGTNLRWKDLNLYLLFDIKVGGKMWDGTRGALDYFGTSEGSGDREELYVFEGIVESTGQVNAKPVLLNQAWRQSGGSGFTGPSYDYIEKSNWVRLRTVTLSYTFTRLLKKTFIKGLELYFTGTNLWLSTPYKGIDPETNLLGASNAQGMDYFNMPGTKSYTVGINLAL
jgi:TonB-linked SusC/RagA family outer membrane protein